MKTEYQKETIELLENERFIAEQFNGGKLPLECDERKLDGLGYGWTNDKGANSCQECNVELSDKEAIIYAKYSKSDKTLCLDCNSNHTINMSIEEMAKAMMIYHGWKDNDILYTLKNKFESREDLAFMLMATCPKESYNMEGEF